MHLVIRTVEKEIFSGKVERVQLPGSMGSFEVLLNHAPLVSSLVKGVVRYRDSIGMHNVSIDSGVVEVLSNRVKVLVTISSDIIGKK